MARGIFNSMTKMALAAERASRERAKEHARIDKGNQRRARIEERAGKQFYKESRAAVADDLNTQLAAQLEQLNTILVCVLSRNPTVSFERFLKYPTEADLDSDQTLRLIPEPQRENNLPKKPSFFARLIPWINNRYLASVIAAEERFLEQLRTFEEIQRRRRDAMANLRAAADEHNRSLKAAETALRNNDPDAIRNYFELVLSTSSYPAKFPRTARVAYTPESKQLAFDYQLPLIDDIIPKVEKYKYVKTADTILESKKSERARQILYANVIAQIALRCLHEIFAADKHYQIDVVALKRFRDDH
jgi:restriction system protein